MVKRAKLAAKKARKLLEVRSAPTGCQRAAASRRRQAAPFC